MAYSILADETADVSGKEQLSIGVRFYDESKSKIREEFVGFVELKAQNASAIAEAIDNFLISSNLSKEDCVGFGFDGCSTMAGKEELVKSLETLSVEGNYATRKSAYQLHSAVTKPVFIVSLQTIAKYSAVIEPVVNALQAKSIDMISQATSLVYDKTSIADLHKNAESFQEFYNLDITGELNLWHNLWVTKALSDDQLKDIEVVDLFKEANIFYPAVRKALIILSTIPCTTATVERSFSTLRRVKTWLRSTMGEERLTGLCLMSVHRNYLKDNSEFIEKIVIDKFSANPRRLLLN
nr:unnamed protein product [Callosobruchus analis]